MKKHSSKEVNDLTDENKASKPLARRIAVLAVAGIGVGTLSVAIPRSIPEENSKRVATTPRIVPSPLAVMHPKATTVETMATQPTAPTTTYIAPTTTLPEANSLPTTTSSSPESDPSMTYVESSKVTEDINSVVVLLHSVSAVHDNDINSEKFPNTDGTFTEKYSKLVYKQQDFEPLSITAAIVYSDQTENASIQSVSVLTEVASTPGYFGESRLSVYNRVGADTWEVMIADNYNIVVQATTEPLQSLATQNRLTEDNESFCIQGMKRIIGQMGSLEAYANIPTTIGVIPGTE